MVGTFTVKIFTPSASTWLPHLLRVTSFALCNKCGGTMSKIVQRCCWDTLRKIALLLKMWKRFLSDGPFLEHSSARKAFAQIGTIHDGTWCSFVLAGLFSFSLLLFAVSFQSEKNSCIPRKVVTFFHTRLRTGITLRHGIQFLILKAEAELSVLPQRKHNRRSKLYFSCLDDFQQKYFVYCCFNELSGFWFRLVGSKVSRLRIISGGLKGGFCDADLSKEGLPNQLKLAESVPNFVAAFCLVIRKLYLALSIKLELFVIFCLHIQSAFLLDAFVCQLFLVPCASYF